MQKILSTSIKSVNILQSFYSQTSIILGTWAYLSKTAANRGLTVITTVCLTTLTHE